MSQKTTTLPVSAAELQPGTFDRPADATALYRYWGAHLVEGFRQLERLFPGKVTNGRGRGYFLAFDLPDTETRNRTLTALNESDVLGLASGDHAIRMRPPLVLSRTEADEGLRRIERALATILS